MNKRKIGLPVVIGMCLITIVVMIAVLIVGNKKTQINFTPPPFDSSAQSGIPDVPENLGYSEFDVQVFTMAVCGKLIYADTKVDVFLTNPESNTYWLKLRIVDEAGKTLGETGLIKPGEYVQSLTLDIVPKSSTAVKLKIMSYEKETYYSGGSASLNTTLVIQ